MQRCIVKQRFFLSPAIRKVAVRLIVLALQNSLRQRRETSCCKEFGRGPEGGEPKTFFCAGIFFERYAAQQNSVFPEYVDIDNLWSSGSTVNFYLRYLGSIPWTVHFRSLAKGPEAAR